MERVQLSSAGLLISKPGKSVTSGSVSDFLVNTTLRNARYFARGTVTSLPWLGASGGVAPNIGYTYEVSIYHGLGYVPVIMFTDEATVSGTQTGYPTLAACGCTADSANLYVARDYNSTPSAQPSSVSCLCHYTIFAEEWTS